MGIWHVWTVTLEAVEDREARLVWQTDIENDCARHKLLREAQGFLKPSPRLTIGNPFHETDRAE